jgi:hypothetical protein
MRVLNFPLTRDHAVRKRKSVGPAERHEREEGTGFD